MELKKRQFKVEIRVTCKVCNKPINEPRCRTYCSSKCRNKRNYKASYENVLEYNRKKRGEYKPWKIQCPICEKWYVQVCTHVLHRHKMSAREFKEQFGYDVKRGRVPEYYKKLKGDIAKENGTTKNLIIGKKYRFKKGQEGVGVYDRSQETIERLKNLHKLTKKYARKQKGYHG